MGAIGDLRFGQTDFLEFGGHIFFVDERNEPGRETDWLAIDTDGEAAGLAVVGIVVLSCHRVGGEGEDDRFLHVERRLVEKLVVNTDERIADTEHFLLHGDRVGLAKDDATSAHAGDGIVGPGR